MQGGLFGMWVGCAVDLEFIVYLSLSVKLKT